MIEQAKTTKRQLQNLDVTQLNRAIHAMTILYDHMVDCEKQPLKQSQLTAARLTIEPYLKRLGSLDSQEDKEGQVTHAQIIEAFQQMFESNLRFVVDMLKINPALRQELEQELKVINPIPHDEITSIESKT